MEGLAGPATPCKLLNIQQLGASLVAQTVKDLPAEQETRFDPWVGKIPWRRAWQPTPVSLPGESHGQRSLVRYIQSTGW